MSLLALPAETLDHIFSLVRNQDRLALATTNRRLSALARRLLYHTIVIPETAFASNDDCQDELPCLRALAQNTTLALTVRHFSLAVPQPCASLAKSNLIALREALSNMTRLLSLSLFIGSSHSSTLDSPALYQHLRVFASDFTLDAATATFLARCPSLADLQLDLTPPTASPARLSPTALPQLRAFTGAADAARALVPGRPVASAHLHFTNLAAADRTLRALARSTAPLRSLQAVGDAPALPVLQAVARRLPTLYELRVHAPDALQDPTAVARIADALATIENLTLFELAGAPWSAADEPDSAAKHWQPSPRPFSAAAAAAKPPEGEVGWEMQGDFLAQEDWATAAW